MVDALLTSGRIEQQSYRSCMGLLRLAERHSPKLLEKACEKTLSSSSHPSYKSINNLLIAMKSDPDKPVAEEDATVNKPKGITRGARYYGGKNT